MGEYKQSSHDFALPTVRALGGVLRLLNLRDQELERLGDVLVIAGTGLGPRAVELLRQPAPILLADLSLLWPQIALVTHNDDRDPVRALREREGTTTLAGGAYEVITWFWWANWML